MPRFYVNFPLEESIKIELPLNIVRHLQVLRLKLNEEITLFNGGEYEYSAIILSLERKKVTVQILKSYKVHNNSQLKLTLAMAIIANDKMDLIIQKATELGVNEIIPIISERSQKINSKRLEHWQKIIISSCEQCGRNSLTTIQQPIALKQLFIDYKNPELKLVLSPHDNNDINSKVIANDILLLVGPEGGFTNAEIKSAKLYAYKTIKLGENILRAETAAIAGLSVIQTIFGSFKFKEDGDGKN